MAIKRKNNEKLLNQVKGFLKYEEREGKINNQQSKELLEILLNNKSIIFQKEQIGTALLGVLTQKEYEGLYEDYIKYLQILNKSRGTNLPLKIQEKKGLIYYRIPNPQELFNKSPKKQFSIMDIYANIPLNNDTVLRKIERVSHIHMATALHGFVSDIEKVFQSDTKSFNKSTNCYNLYEALFAILLSLFISYKDMYIGKEGFSWENIHKIICGNELNNLDIQGNVRIINATSKKAKANEKIIDRLRDALAHTRYVPSNNTLYIKNPKDNFEAEIDIGFLINFILSLSNTDTRAIYCRMQTDDKEIYNYSENNTFEYVKKVIHFYIGMLHYGNSTQTTKSLIKNIKNETNNKPLKHKTKEILLSGNLENIVKKYFDSHKIDYKNLSYIASNISEPPEKIMSEIIKFIIIGKSLCFNKKDLMTNFQKKIHKLMLAEEPGYYRGESKEEIEELNNLSKIIINRKQTNGQPLTNRYMGCLKYANKYLTKQRNFKYDSKKRIYKKGNLEIKLDNLNNVCGTLCSNSFIAKQRIESFPNRLKIEFIKYVYINELIPLKQDNITGLIGSGQKKTNDKFTNREHIRNALTHNWYVLLHGVDEIILRDGYNKDNDTYEREEIINLQELYEGTYTEMINNKENKLDLYTMVINYQPNKNE